MIPAVALIVLYVSYVRSHKLSECGNGFYRCSAYDPLIAKYVYSKCIREDLICNGMNNCYYGEDEEDCDPTPLLTNPPTTIKSTSTSPLLVLTSSNEITSMPTALTTPEPTLILITDKATKQISEEPTVSTQNQTADDLTTISVTANPTNMDDPTTKNYNSTSTTTEYITIKKVDSNTMDPEDIANRDYKALYIAVIISILIALVLSVCVMIHRKLARKRKLNDEIMASSSRRMSQRKHR